MKAVTWIYLRPVFVVQSSQMECEPNYILSDAQQQALPPEKLISECPLHPVSITGFPKASAAVYAPSGGMGELSTGIASKRLSLMLVNKQTQQASTPSFMLLDKLLATFLKE